MIFPLTYKKPVLLVGNGVRSAGAAELVYQFAKKTQIPVLTTMNAVDLAQDDVRIGFIGTYGNRVANMILDECDLVISVGARLGLRQIGHIRENFAPKAKLIRVDVDTNELSRVVKDDEQDYLMDAAVFMNNLLQEEIPQYTKWHNRCHQVKKILEAYDNVLGNEVIEKISSLLIPNPVVAVDVGQNQCWSAQSLHLKGEQGRILIGGGYGSMGCGLPYAIGASISSNNGLVYCLTGDGGLQMNIQELETVVREQLPIKIIVLNNRTLGKISEIQSGSYGHRYAQTTPSSGYSVPDFEKIAKAYGIKAATLETHQSLDAYSEWMKDNEPCLINILMPEDTLLIPKIKWETGKIAPALSEDLLEKVTQILEGEI